MRGLQQLAYFLVNSGVRKNYATWEIQLTRKLNYIALIAFVTVIIGISIYEISGDFSFMPYLYAVSTLVPTVWLANRYLGYLWASYIFYNVGYVFYYLMNLILGIDSYMLLFYFPFFISILLLFNRSELMIHMSILLILCVISIIMILIGFNNNYLFMSLDESYMKTVKYANIFLSVFITVFFVLILSREAYKQNKILEETLAEKDVLLSEVFHRVKNNLNVITSLLNLKKEESNSQEVKDALEECRNRVFSMALVHQNIYKGTSFSKLELADYLHDLIDELLNSNDISGNTDVSLECDEIYLDLIHSVPFGLILNELVTNSFKYAMIPNQRLKLNVKVKKDENLVKVKYEDNGPGMPIVEDSPIQSLGWDIISSLIVQMDGTYKVSNKNGFVFEFQFMLPS